MSTYAKLFSSIVHSTIWREANHVRLVWITILALKDKDGIVEASVPGLADVARVTLSECEEALEKLMSPDKYSRTKDFEGRRIEEVPGGWRVLNHALHRDSESLDKRREQDAARAKAYRERKKKPKTEDRHAISRDVTPSDTDQIQIKSEEEKKELTPRQQVIDHYFRQFEAARGVKPSHDGREWKSFDRLLERLKYNVDACNEAITNAFADDWWRSKVTINKIANDPDQFTGRRGGPSGRNQPPQPNDESDRYKPRIFGDP